MPRPSPARIGGTTVKTIFSSHLLTPGGVSIATLPANTVWQALGPLTNELNGDVLEITGITDTNGGYGGASLHAWQVGGNSGLAITLTGGASYKLPATYLLSTAGFLRQCGKGTFHECGHQCVEERDRSGQRDED